jgi:hypothetical protein|tara:strand:- start:368 stop:1117 length:750 start_codon:yes stop_codon:yes gene_type:complete
MRLWRKNKEVVIHCYTDRAEVYNYFPVVINKKIFPEWFKNLKKPYFRTPEDTVTNLKACSGFTGLFKVGFTIPMWSDLFLEIGEEGSDQYRWQYSDQCSEMGQHSEKEYGDYFKKTEYQHLKLISPWVINCDENIDFLAVEPFWQFKTLGNISILPGVVNFNFQASTHINLFVKREKVRQEKVLSAGNPIYTYVPITERPILIQTHLVSSEKLKNFRSKAHRAKFINSYATTARLIKIKGCPYKVDVED